MRAVVIERDAGGAPRPVVRELPASDPGPREVLVRVHAAGMNRADLGLRTGHFRALPGAGSADIAGLELAGEVMRCGAEVTLARPGDRVMAMCGGAHAEQVCVDERLLMPVPERMEWAEAACYPAALMTAHDALVTNGRLAPGQHVMVQAASSAVGIAAVQIASALGAGIVVGTTTSPVKRLLLQQLGLQHALDGADPDLRDTLHRLTGGHGMDIVIDHLGAPALASNMGCAAIGGRIVSVGRMAGKSGDIDLDLLSLKRLSLIGVTFRTRTGDEVARLIAAMRRDVWPLLESGRIRMPLDKVFPLAEVADAHACMAARQQFGKVVLLP